jgi:hypothetical protein
MLTASVRSEAIVSSTAHRGPVKSARFTGPRAGTGLAKASPRTMQRALCHRRRPPGRRTWCDGSAAGERS